MTTKNYFQSAQGLDHVIFGRYFVHYNFPKQPKVEEIKALVPEVLAEIAREKIEELTKRVKIINNFQQIRMRGLDDNLRRQIYTFQAEEEKIFLRKWWYYWSQFLQIARPQRVSGLSQSDIEKAKAYPIEQLFTGRLRRSGKSLAGLCPFHTEKHASFTINLHTNYYTCYGCQKHGDSIDFYMKLNEVDFPTAVKELIR